MKWFRIVSNALIPILAIVIVLGIRMLFYPSNWVEVTLRNVPDGIGQAFLVADRPDGVRAMHWYESKVAPTVFDPRAGGAWHRDVNSHQWRDDVAWLRGDRYGVLAQREDGNWWLWWLGPDDRVGPPAWRMIWGGTRARIDLPGASRASVPSRQVLDRLGLLDSAVGP